MPSSAGNLILAAGDPEVARDGLGDATSTGDEALLERAPPLPASASPVGRLVVAVGCCAAVAVLAYHRFAPIDSAVAPRASLDALAAEDAVKAKKAASSAVAWNMTNGTCDGKGASVSYFASASFPGELPWPHLNAEAYASLSMCATMVPGCSPEQLSGNPDIRSTYGDASSSILALAYNQVFTNYGLLNDLKKHVDCSEEEFQAAVEQLTFEAQYLELLGGYYNVYSDLLSRLGEATEVSFQQTLQLLLEASADYTTSTTPAPHKLLHFAEHQLAHLSVSLLNAVGMCIGIPDLGTGIKVLGTSMVAVTKVADGSESYKQATLGEGEDLAHRRRRGKYTRGDKMRAKKSSSTSPTGNGEAVAGEKDDDMLDELDLGATTFIQKVVVKMQSIIEAERLEIVSNWGRLQGAMSIVRVCPLTHGDLLTAVDYARPVADWFALSALIGAKYTMYWERGYPNPDSSSTSFQCVGSDYCSQMVGGCYTAQDIPSDQSDGNNASRVFWIGQNLEFGNGPPAGFWRYLLRENGPIAGFINPVFKQSITDAQSASDAILSQCTYVQKIYAAGSVGQPSDVVMLCDVFGFPWPIRAFPDCPGSLTSSPNTYACTSENCDSPNIANNNEMFWIPLKKHHWSTQEGGMYGCCAPGKKLADLPPQCNFIVCDCASLSSAVFISTLWQTVPENIVLWWGLCSYEAYSAPDSFTSGDLTFPADYIQTSLGVSWKELLESPHKIERAIKKAEAQNFTAAEKEAKLQQIHQHFIDEEDLTKQKEANEASNLPIPMATTCSKHSQCQSTGAYCAPSNCYTTDGQCSGLVLCDTCSNDCNHVNRRRTYEQCQCR